MIGVDTNVLVRLLTGDEPGQTRAARTALARAENEGERIFVSLPVVCELAWTLRSSPYRFDRDAVANGFDNLLEGVALEFQERDAVIHALEEFRSGPGDFSDYLIARLGASAGCIKTLTFDSHLRKHQHFEILRS